ncbi:MAG: hypothetical protein KDA28_12215, partial [Phycisphaerales bacterium]|nr:hypothetical protein [Phycisphaerales bacterium]
PLRRVHIPWMDLTVAMTENEGAECYLDCDTGRVIMLFDPFVSGEADTELREAIDEDGEGRYVSIPRDETRSAYRRMERFVGTVDAESARAELERALEGKGAFRRFGNTVYGLGMNKQWFAFREHELQKEGARWLERIGVEPTNPLEIPAPTVADDPAAEEAPSVPDGLMQQAALLEEVAAELDRAAQHARRAADHFRSGAVPPACAHVLATQGHCRRTSELLGEVAVTHAAHADPD